MERSSISGTGTEETADEAIAMRACVLIEADGAKGRPYAKAPADSTSRYFIPIRSWCCRSMGCRQSAQLSKIPA